MHISHLKLLFATVSESKGCFMVGSRATGRLYDFQGHRGKLWQSFRADHDLRDPSALITELCSHTFFPHLDSNRGESYKTTFRALCFCLQICFYDPTQQTEENVPTYLGQLHFKYVAVLNPGVVVSNFFGG